MLTTLGRVCTTNLCAVLVVICALGACSLDDVKFANGGDAAIPDDAAIDAPPAGPPGFLVSSTDMTVIEGQTQTVTIALTAPPSAAMLVNLEVSDDAKVGVTPTALLFTGTDWSVPQTVTLTGKHDADVSDETLTVTFRSSSIPDPVTVQVTIDDDDGLALILTPSSLDIGEGSTGTITARLSAQPQADVVVSIATTNPAVATLSQPMFTFTTANWAIDQNMVITGMQDTDTANGIATVTFMSPALTSASVPVQVTDDDVLGIASSTSAISTSEGQSQTFTVTLTQQPVSNVTVTLAAMNTAVATVSPTSLSFTSATWSTPQTVTVTAVQDDDVANGATSVSLMATGLTTRSINVSVIDDDIQVIEPTPTSLTVAEGASGSINVRLAYRPAGNVTVTTASLDTSAATVSPTSLTFSPSNFGVGQMVSVAGLQDDDAANDTTTMRFEVAADGLISNVATTVTDDDTLGILLSTTTAALTEGGATTFMVRLTAQPTANTLVTIASSNTSSVTVSPASLTFSASTWNTNQSVTLTGVEDSNLVNEAVTMSATSAGLTTRNVAVTVTDNDAQTITTTLPAVTVTEGTTATIGVRLAYQPAANVTVNVASSATGVATATPVSLTFTTTTWNSDQNVTITGVQDADAVNGSANLTLSAAGITTQTVPIMVTDDDAVNIDVSPTSLTVAENGMTTLQVRLTAQPAAATTVNVVSSDTAAATLSVASVSFSTTDWSSFKSVTVSGVQDANASNEAVTITASSAGLANRTASVTVVDDDTLAIQASAATVTVGEGLTTTFQVRLTAQPSGNTTVNLATSNAGAATISPASLAFTTSTWNTYQTVTVAGVSDANTANESVTFTLSASGLANVTVAGTVTDDDTQVVQVTPTTRTIGEGTSNTVSVTLLFQPVGTYVVTVTSASTNVATVSPSTLSFNSSNYQTAQLVTITGTQDANAVENATTVSLTGAGATSGSVSVSVPDDDVLGIQLDTTALTINEGGNGTFQARLTAQPAATTAVTLTSNDMGAATVTGSLSFTTGNWNTYQSATVTGAEDADSGNENVTISAAAAGMSTQTVAVNVIDNDVQSIVISTTSASLLEGVAGQNSVSVGIKLAAQPPSDIAVTITSTDPGAISTSVSSRTFTSVNYAAEQFVTISAVVDSDWNFEQGAVNFTASGLTTRTTNVFVTEPAIIEPEVSAISVCEGSSASLGVRLRGNPIGPLTVQTTPNNAWCSVTPADRTYTSGTFSTLQYFTVTGNTAGGSSVTIASPTLGVNSQTVTVDVVPASAVQCGGPGSCGDGVCTFDEQNSCSCSLDCGSCSGVCGDGICTFEESCNCVCFPDCGSCFFC